MLINFHSPIGLLLLTVPSADVDEAALRKAITFYASFDEAVKGDVGGGDLTVSTRFNHETEPGQFVFEKGFNADVFHIAADKGVQGGALECCDVLPRNGRIFFPARGNVAFQQGGWGGAVSVWINTDPDTLLKTKFCDPVQITEKGAMNGGIWFDFNDATPRDLRMGTFPSLPEGQKPMDSSDPHAPITCVNGVSFKSGDWHHVALTWDNFDTGNSDGHAALFIDGKLIGGVKDSPLSMGWDVDKAGIYFAISYIGLLDELAVFNRPLTAAEVEYLHRHPGALAALKR
jgi:hypothetical protein